MRSLLSFFIFLILSPLSLGWSQTPAPERTRPGTAAKAPAPAPGSPSQRLRRPASTPSPAQLEALLERQPENIRAREALARVHEENQDFKKVIELLNPYSERISLESQLILAGAYGQLKNYDNQVRILRLVVSADSQNHLAHFILGDALLAQKKEGEAIKSFREAISLNPKFKPAYDSLLNIFIANDNRYEARLVLDDIMQQFGQRPEVLNDLCRLYAIDGFLSQAIDFCQIGITRSPNFPDNYIYLAQAHTDRDDPQEGERILIAAAKRFPNSELAQWAAGDFFFHRKNFTVASRYFRAALSADQDSGRSHLGLAKSLVEMAQAEEAFRHFRRACELNSAHVSDIQSVARGLRARGESALAQRYTGLLSSCRANPRSRKR